MIIAKDDEFHDAADERYHDSGETPTKAGKPRKRLSAGDTVGQFSCQRLESADIAHQCERAFAGCSGFCFTSDFRRRLAEFWRDSLEWHSLVCEELLDKEPVMEIEFTPAGQPVAYSGAGNAQCPGECTRAAFFSLDPGAEVAKEFFFGVH